MGTYLFRTENISTLTEGRNFTITHALGTAPAAEDGEVFIRHRTFTCCATIMSSSSQIVVLNSGQSAVQVDVTVMRFHSIIK